MGILTTGTFDRPDELQDSNDPRVLYARSYLLTRMVIGAVGVLLPTSLFVLDGLVLRGGIAVRGSLSAYYHSSARDLFVGALCVMGVMLLTYMAGQARTWDFWLSSLSGLAVLGVAFFPTKRPNLDPTSPLCGAEADPVPAGCTHLQQAIGETSAATIHYISAGIFILSLAVICFLFARREVVFDGHSGRALFHRVCGVLILAAVAWIGLGRAINVDVFSFTPLYVGEVVSVYAFGASWLVKAWDLLRSVVRRILS